ncbi:hypothetical protein FKW77_009763 [Venturia effusa]|uniref:G protein-coupled receptor GPR1/2/3 C-terminal domain-containing protein n=1 Tax=Venturia effusa TaxID=50376 RepID=A0A517LBQ0_9PEZI|nr:hypothetical protein FKW77_009763 [Venturia effusa]
MPFPVPSAKAPPMLHDLGGFDSLSPLTPQLQIGLIPVTLLGLLSAVSSVTLLCILSWRIWKWNRRAHNVNQFVFLIYNLILADIQQAFAFLLNAQWLMSNSIDVGTRTCWAQGWFVSTGDMGSGIWSFVIGLHTFAVVIFGFKLSNRWFALAVVLCWVLNYGLALLSVALHPNLFVRAVSWCWIHPRYKTIRLWLHYAWIFFFEGGTVVVYASMIFALRHRIKTNFYRSAQRTRNARDAAHLMIVYPVIYVVCTLPLATLRMFSMAHPDIKISGGWFCFAGAMITSNGWCDVLLYSLTRRIVLFSDEPPPMDNGIDTFFVPWRKDCFGTETTCVHVPNTVPSAKARYDNFQPHQGEDSASQELVFIDDKSCRQQGNEGLDFVRIEEKVTVEVKNEPMTHAQLCQMRTMKHGQVSMDGGSTFGRKLSTRDTNSDCTSTRQLWANSKSHSSSHEDVSSIIKGTNESPVQRTVNETPQSERSNSETHGSDSMDFHTSAHGF